MKKSFIPTLLLLLTLMISLSSCEAIAGIFKAGFWTAIIMVVLVVGLVLFFIGRSRK